MGLRTSWIAVNGLEKSQVLDALGVVETGELEGMMLAPMAVTTTPAGWVVVHYGKDGEFERKRVAALFPDAEVVGGQSSEIVMVSDAFGLQAGQLVWAVDYHCEKGRFVSAEGSLPPVFPEIRDKYLRMQAEDPHGDEVDHVFEVPMALTTALCGYDPTRQDTSLPFQVVERRLKGAAGERQDAAIAMRRRLSAAIDDELIPAAQALGFQRASDLPPDYPAPNSPTMLVRFRDGLSEIIDFHLDVGREGSRIAMSFFVRKGVEYRGGNPGIAQVPKPQRWLFDFLSKSKESPDGAFTRAVDEARGLLDHIDAHLKDGTSHPHIKPARYYDAPGA